MLCLDNCDVILYKYPKELNLLLLINASITLVLSIYINKLLNSLNCVNSIKKGSFVGLYLTSAAMIGLSIWLIWFESRTKLTVEEMIYRDRIHYIIF